MLDHSARISVSLSADRPGTPKAVRGLRRCGVALKPRKNLRLRLPDAALDGRNQNPGCSFDCRVTHIATPGLLIHHFQNR